MRNLPITFAVTLFGSALLSFSIQPILGKMLLPMVGGAPAGWIVAMAFFQLALLAGYGVSYALGRVSPWLHACALLALYVAGMAYLPPQLPVLDSDTHGMALSITVVKALFQAIFVPFLALTATTAALQRVFAATKHSTANDPYYLFVASNIGSFIGLLLYPFFLEPVVGLAQQTDMWRWVYIGVTVLVAVATLQALQYRRPTEAKTKKAKAASLTVKDRLMWLALAFIPCSLSMGVTTLITADVGGLPLFWVLPLGLYLLTFVLAFAQHKKMATNDLTFWHHTAVALFFTLSMVSSKNGVWQQSLLAFVITSATFLAVFFMIAWSCHQRLADSRPSPSALPQFYFMLALGGALAGCVHAFVLPYVLHGPYEFSIAVAASLLLSKEWSRKFKEYRFGPVLNSSNRLLALGLVGLALGAYLYRNGASSMVTGICILIFVIVYLLFALQPRRSLLCAIAVFVATNVVMERFDTLAQHRNFFGTFRVFEAADGDKRIRRFVHGTTLHGIAVLDKDGKMHGDSFGYYMRGGPIDEVLAMTHAKSFGVLGLGTGQLACFSKAAKTDIFEIDPDIVGMAKKFFPYLNKCPPRHVYVGDGRIEIAKSKNTYDVILQDAFTSDGIPTHLLTHEAFIDYKKKMNKHGVILFHVSNRYLDLAAPIAATADTVGLKAYGKYYLPPKRSYLALASRWVAVPMDKEQGEILKEEGWSELSPNASQPWTDDRSSLFEALVPLF